MRKIIFLFLTFTMILVATIKAQNVVGTVVDESNGSSIPGATVYLKSTNYGTITDINGGFELKAKSGDFKLVVSSVGFKTFEKDVNLEQGQDLDLGTIELKVDAIGIEEIKIMASFAQDRKTPVSTSTIEPTVITEKLGTKEYPEILKSTPSVYATKQGGGFGDSRINIRGFSSENVGVLINGMPVNDMESGWVYWSNWAGLSDVTRTMQVQRGLGAAKVALSSVGGTINIITKTTDAVKGGSVLYSIGNDGYVKQGFNVSTGMYDNGWAVTVSGSHSTGNGYVRGTNFEAWSYFMNVAKQFSPKHQVSFTMIGAPQWHNQRNNKHLIETYRNSPWGRKFNSDFGYRDNKVYPIGYAYNYYNKPVAMINDFLKLSKEWELNTVLYASWGRGGGRRSDGAQVSTISIDYNTGLPYDNTFLTPDGLIDWNAAEAMNQASLTGSQAIISNAVNSHNWYGLLSTLSGKMGNITITTGVDARYYIGIHYKEIEDLLGGSYYLDTKNINRDANLPLYKGDKIAYHNLGIVSWGGLFGQAEYSTTNFTAFVSLAGSYSTDQRVDYFQYTPETKVGVRPGDTVVGQKTPQVPFLTYSIKGGLNYNISDNFNVFANAGYFTRPPYMKFVFKNNTNAIFDSVKLEKIMTFEGGLGYKSRYFKANVYGYYTNWLNKSLTVKMGTTYANIPNLNALHKGLEFTAEIRPLAKMSINLMASVGDWRWKNNVVADIYDENQVFLGKTNVYAKGLHVSDAAQTTGAIGWNYEILPKLKVAIDWTYYDRIYAQFNVEKRTNATDTADSWRMPSYNLFDVSAIYNFNIGNSEASLIGNVDNLFDVEYLSDGKDGATHDATSALVYYGFGRTWVMTLRVKF